MAQREAEREARIAAERSRPPRPNVARAAAAAAPAPASSATTRQIRSDRALAESLSEEVVEQSVQQVPDTPMAVASHHGAQGRASRDCMLCRSTALRAGAI